MKDVKVFLKAASIRSLRTVAQSIVALIPAGIMISEVDWKVVLSTSLLAGFLSILNSIITGLPELEEK